MMTETQQQQKDPDWSLLFAKTKRGSENILLPLTIDVEDGEASSGMQVNAEIADSRQASLGSQL